MEQKELLVLDALLDSKSISDAAAKAQVSRTTIYKFLADHEFLDELQNLRQQVLVSRVNEISEKRSAALEILADVMSDPQTPPAARISAAKTLLDYSNTMESEADKALNTIYLKTDPIDGLLI